MAELAFGDEVEIEKDKWKIAVTSEEFGILESLLGSGAAEPDEMATVVVSISSGINVVTSIDEGDWEITLFI